MQTNRRRMIVAAVLALGASSAALAQPFELSWYSVDGGGEIGSTGGTFEMSSTIGQPDAGAMTGGFWSVAGSSLCDSCDMNCDGSVDANDIEFFIDILFNGATPCGTCTGDTNGDGFVDAGDIEGFINCLFPQRGSAATEERSGWYHSGYGAG